MMEFKTDRGGKYNGTFIMVPTASQGGQVSDQGLCEPFGERE
jgi:hypothetical protein